MSRVFKLAVAAVFGVTVLYPVAADACSPRVRMQENQTVQRIMQVRSGKSCTVGFQSLGPVEAIKIVKRPSHGTVETNHFMSIKYRAHAGYVGTDSFTYARVGRDSRNNPTVRTIAVSVTVTP